MAGNWSGAGTVTLDDGSTERIRCRATYAVGAGGNGLQQTLTCASDSYKFNLTSNIMAQGSAISGTWSEASRNINGNIEGRSGGGNFQVVATAPGFSANISLTTRGNKQSVVIKAESQFKGASISLSRALMFDSSDYSRRTPHAAPPAFVMRQRTFYPPMRWNKGCHFDLDLGAHIDEPVDVKQRRGRKILSQRLAPGRADAGARGFVFAPARQIPGQADDVLGTGAGLREQP